MKFFEAEMEVTTSFNAVLEGLQKSNPEAWERPRPETCCSCLAFFHGSKSVVNSELREDLEGAANYVQSLLALCLECRAFPGFFLVY
jgi:hypothetical protein